MSKVVVDSALQAKLTDPSGVVEVCDQQGRTIGFFHAANDASTASGGRLRSPVSDEEIQRRRRQKRGRPLRDILDDLEQS
jgi:hypothetical protein